LNLEDIMHPLRYRQCQGRWSRLVCACLVAAGMTQPAGAKDKSKGSDDKPQLFGDWNGERTRLADEGITFDLGYDSQVAHNIAGGTRHLTRYTDQWSAGATLDLDKLWNWHGATLRILYTQRDGRDLGADAGLGTSMSVQDLFGRGQTLHLTILALEQKFLGGKLAWRVGRLPVGRDFATFSCDFQNLTFCGSQPGNLVGDYWLNWPSSSWGTRLKWKTSTSTYVQLGAYQVNPTYVDPHYEHANGWKPDFPAGTTGTLVPLEFGWTPKRNGLPGSYKIGFWYDTSGGDDLFLDVDRTPLPLSGAPALHRDARTGGYIDFKQQVNGDAGGKGLTVFLRVTQADHPTATLDRQISLGAQYKGPFGRTRDKIGFGLGATHSNDYAAVTQRLRNQLDPANAQPVHDGNEYAAEIFYRWSPVPAFDLQPSLQYVINPGASDKRDALVVGLFTSIKF
jgi:porin